MLVLDIIIRIVLVVFIGLSIKPTIKTIKELWENLD